MSDIGAETVRRLVAKAYADGWADACRDHLTQKNDPTHPIGAGRQVEVANILTNLDPRDVLGLRRAES